MSRIAFVAPRALLDTRTGAAVSLHSVLEALADAGHDCRAITCTLFYGDREYPLARAVGERGAGPDYIGRRLRIHCRGVVHELYRTRSTVEANLHQAEADDYGRLVAQVLREAPPDLVITLGADAVARDLHAQLRCLSPRLVFYLATEHHRDAAMFAPFDHVLVPSGFMQSLYARTLGLQTEVLPSVIAETSYAAPEETLAAAPEARRHGLVTMVNPAPEKGATLFVRLLDLALREAPELTFLGVEGRYTMADWRAAGVDLAQQSNLWWLPNQRDLRRVYARTTALLVPSFWEEASARVIAEAQLGGLPVLASNHAGIPEQLNGGGFAFDIPMRCRERYNVVPEEDEARPWLNTLQRLAHDESAFRSACDRALTAAEPWRPERAAERVEHLFQRILSDEATGVVAGH